MNVSTPIQRVVLKNYKSIANCSVTLQPLVFLVGQNGSGKSNFLDALRLVTEAVINHNGQTIIGPVDTAGRSAIQDKLFTAGELLRLNQLTPDPKD